MRDFRERSPSYRETVHSVQGTLGSRPLLPLYAIKFLVPSTQTCSTPGGGLRMPSLLLDKYMYVMPYVRIV